MGCYRGPCMQELTMLGHEQIIRRSVGRKSCVEAVYIYGRHSSLLQSSSSKKPQSIRYTTSSSRCLSVLYSALACWRPLWSLPCPLQTTSQPLAAPALPTAPPTQLLTLPLILPLTLLPTLPPTPRPTPRHTALQLLLLLPPPPALLPTPSRPLLCWQQLLARRV